MSPDDDSARGTGSDRETDDDGWAVAAREKRSKGDGSKGSGGGDIEAAPARPSPSSQRPNAPADADLRAAVGVTTPPTASAATTGTAGKRPSKKSDESQGGKAEPGGPGAGKGKGDPGPKAPRGPGMNRRALIALVAVGLFLVAIFVIWFLGQRNSRSYYIVCGDTITAERGRSFPPWGSSELSGDEWRPIEIIVELSPCDEATFTDQGELEARFRDLLLYQADAWLQAMDAQSPRTGLATVRAQLEQAVTLSRASDDSSIEARKRIGWLLGDVARWEAQNELDAARERLGAAREKLREAVDKKPMHVRDADAWRRHLESMLHELEAGPPSLRPEQTPGDGNVDHVGVDGSGTPSESSVDLGGPGEPHDATGPSDGSGEPGLPPVRPEDASPADPVMPNPPPPGSGTLL